MSGSAAPVSFDGRIAMPRLRIFPAAAIVAILACQAGAETPEELDHIAYAATHPVSGMDLARAQAGRGELLEALSTLERLLAFHPRIREARLLHASILCRADDREGAAAEFAELRRKDFRPEEWDAANAACTQSGGS